MVLSLRVLSHRGHLDSRSFTHIYGGVHERKITFLVEIRDRDRFFFFCSVDV